MTLKPEFHFLEVAYPYVARRLLTDEDPALRERLFQVGARGGERRKEVEVVQGGSMPAALWAWAASQGAANERRREWYGALRLYASAVHAC